jgi:hypothetical protein
MKKLIFDLSALCLYMGSGMAEIPMDHCKLYAPLDEGQLVAYPKGVKTSFPSGTPMFKEGKKGTALVCDSEEISVPGVKLMGSDLIDGEKGTIAFWMKPILKYGEGKKPQTFFYTRKGSGHSVFISNPKQGLYFQTKNQGKWISPHFNFSWFKKPQWSPDNWYHITITWGDGNGTLFYINGAKVSKQKGGNSVVLALDHVMIGCQGSGRNSSDAIMDDLYIFDKALTREEITELMKP